MISPMQPCVLNIGEIHGGTVRNIVASQTSSMEHLELIVKKSFHVL